MSAEILTLVEQAWNGYTNGELALGGEDPDFVDPDTVALVKAMAANARDYITTVAAQQYDTGGNEITDVSDAELARRIVVALDGLWHGGHL